MPLVLEKLRAYWWCLTDENCLDIPLQEVNQFNALGEQPIHIASWKGSAEDVRWLIENGADVNSIGDLGMTPLHYAYMGGKLDNVQALIDGGADASIRCDQRLLPKDSSARTKE